MIQVLPGYGRRIGLWCGLAAVLSISPAWADAFGDLPVQAGDDVRVQAQWADDNATTATDEGPEPNAPRISNIFIDTDLRQALQDIGAQAMINIIPDPSVGGLVTAELDDVTVDKALQIILAGTGFQVLRTSDYYLIYSADERSDAFMDVSRTRVLKLNHAEAAAVRRMLSNRWQEFVRADERSNTLVITAPEPQLLRILEDIKQLDIPRRHVMLDARVVVLENNDLLDLGVDWTFPRISAGTFSDDTRHGGGASGASWPWGIRIGYTPGREFTNSLMLTLNLLTQNDQASIIASPQLLGQDARRAEIRVTTEEYFEILTDGAFTRSQLEKIETGTILRITPRIGDDDTVTLDMQVEVSDVVSRGQSNLPVVSRRVAESTVQISSGGTAAVAGLTDSRSQTRRNAVPGAGNLPLIGGLFTRDATAHQSRQVAVFITASIVDPQVEHMPRGPRRPALPEIDEQDFREALRITLQRLDWEAN